MRFIFFLIKRYLFKDPQKSLRSWIIFVATAGIFLATSMVLVGLGVLSGYQKVYKEAILGFGSHLIVYNESGLSKNDQTNIENFLKQTKIKNHFSPYHFHEVLTHDKNGPKPVILKGIDMDKLKQVYPMTVKIWHPEKSHGVLLGYDLLVGSDGLKEKGFLSYLTSESRDVQQVQAGKLDILGSFKSGYYDFDSRFVIMPLETMGKLFFHGPMVSGYEIRLDDVDQINVLKRYLIAEFGMRFEILTWTELNHELFKALTLDRTVVFAICFLIILIACMNVFGFNFLFFVQRKREFLILSALGLSLRKLRQLLIGLSFLLGGVAALLGGVVAFLVMMYLKGEPGVPLDPVVYYVNKIPVSFEFVWFVGFLLGIVILCYLTSFIAGRVILRRHMTANLDG